MTKDERYLARMMLKLEFFKRDKQAFEDLFTLIKQKEDIRFNQVKPQGRLGDGKCDGFNPGTGDYYQVYAPEDFTGKENKSLEKMENSFTELIAYWKKNNFDVKKFHFVINDKYSNVYASLHTMAKSLTTKFNIECQIVTCKDLENTFLNLSDDFIIDIIGIIPNLDNINDNIDYKPMSEVVKHLLQSEPRHVTEAIPQNPNFKDKIVFNSLSSTIAEYLNVAQRQSFAVKDYFELNSDFLKDTLRDSLHSLYKEAVKSIPDSETKNDEVFQYIVDKASTRKTYAHYNAIYILMAYYFEYCDIFETPK